jgi:probable HAF family extracellular repeat protein
MRRLLLVGAVVAAGVALVAVAASVAAVSGAPGSVQARWVMTDLGTLGGSFSVALALNERGQVAGTSRTANGQTHVFLWEKGRMTDLGQTQAGSTSVLLNARGRVVWFSPAGASMTWDGGVVRKLGLTAIAMNDVGQVVGSKRFAGGAERAVVWERGRIRDLGTLGGKSSYAVAINNDGQVVVNSETSGKDEHGSPAWRVFLWQDGKRTDIGTLGGKASDACAINERAQIIGFSATGTEDVWNPFLWQKGRMKPLSLTPAVPPEWGSRAWYCFPGAINDRGQIVGETYTKAGRRRAVLWENEKMTDLGTLGGRGSFPEAINEHGQIVGTSRTKRPQPSRFRDLGELHAFVWENGVMTDLARRGTGPRRSYAHAINDKSQIVGASQTGAIAAPGTPTQQPAHHAVLWTLKQG